MIPRIANRGHSFKGAGQYYLHDKSATTDERVQWTYTHNLPTNDPHKAMGYMAYTAMNAERLKHQHGGSKVGRKSKAKPVYSYSLSWHPEQEPSQETMQIEAVKVLEQLGLIEHEAVFVAHNDTEHAHVHVVCNVIHPETGKIMAPSYDYITTSNYAENLEREDGKIYCEQRIINNEKRRNEAKENRQLGMVKHREKKLEGSQIIDDLFRASESGKSFQAALKTEGYTLAKGDRRSLVLVDGNGKTHSLYRQIKGFKAKEINSRLKDVEQLPHAKDIIVKQDPKNQHQHQQRKKEKKKLPELKNNFKEAVQINKRPSLKAEFNKPQVEEKGKEIKGHLNVQENDQQANSSPTELNNGHLNKLDELRAWEQKTQREKDRLMAKLTEQYNLKGLHRQIDKMQQKLKNNNGWWYRNSGKQKEDQENLEALQMNMIDINQRIKEQQDAFSKASLESKPRNKFIDQEKYIEQQLTKEEEQNRLMAEMRSKIHRPSGRGRSL